MDNKLVRADVFVRKLQALLKGMHLADREANGTNAHEFIVEDLRIGSALVKVREKIKHRDGYIHSSVETYRNAMRSVYDAQPTARKLPVGLVTTFKTLCTGSEDKFQHAELDFDSDNLIRVDDYLLRQTERILENNPVKKTSGSKSFFRGVAMGTFDGALRVMDSRGELLRATLVTTAGSKEIDCIVKKDKIEEFAKNFEHRVRIEGVAHYDGENALPIRVDVKAIRQIKIDADLRRWRGAFSGSAAMREDWQHDS